MSDGTRRPASKTGPGRRQSRRAAKLDSEVRARLGQQLRAMYDDVVQQGVPDRFADLLRQIEATNPEEPEK